MKKRYLCRICCLLLLWFALAGLVRGRTGPPLCAPVPEGETVCVSGTVYRREFTDTGQRIYLKNTSILFAADSLPDIKDWGKKRIIAYLREEQRTPIGSRVLVSGVCAYPQAARNPGGFDAQSYYGAMGVGMLLRKADVREQDGSVYWIRNAIADFRDFCRAQLVRAGEDTDAGVLSAMLLGDKGILDAQVKDLYQSAGIVHLLAISGLHISLTGMALYRLLRKLRLSFGAAGAVAGTLMCAYACMTGYPVSAVRAVLMFLIFLLSQVTGRTYDLPTSLMVSAAAILIGKSDSIGQAGFWLSFGAVGGVLLSGLWESRPLKNTSLGVSIAVQFATIPLTAYYYYQIPVYAVVLNLCVLWTMPFLLGFGMAGMGAAVLSPVAGRFLLAPAHYLLAFIEELCGRAKLLPFASYITGQPPLWRIVLYYTALAAMVVLLQKVQTKPRVSAFFGNPRKIDLIKLLFASILLIGTLSIHCPRGLVMTFLDVGQGDGCCIQNGARSVWMVDGGSSSETKLAQYTLEPFFKSQGIRRVDHWMISHYDKDHISGLLEILESYQRALDGENASGISIGEILLPDVQDTPELAEQLLALADAAHIPVRRLKKGDRVTDGALAVHILSPEKGMLYENSNAASVVAQFTCGSFDALLTGDLEGAGESALLQSGLLEDVDVLKAAHHGSRNSTSGEFLQAARPELTVISCGRQNSYGHPHAELLQRLENCESRIARTDLQGAVQIYADESGYRAQGYVRQEMPAAAMQTAHETETEDGT